MHPTRWVGVLDVCKTQVCILGLPMLGKGKKKGVQALGRREGRSSWGAVQGGGPPFLGLQGRVGRGLGGDPGRRGGSAGELLGGDCKAISVPWGLSVGGRPGSRVGGAAGTQSRGTQDWPGRPSGGVGVGDLGGGEGSGDERQRSLRRRPGPSDLSWEGAGVVVESWEERGCLQLALQFGETLQSGWGSLSGWMGGWVGAEDNGVGGSGNACPELSASGMCAGDGWQTWGGSAGLDPSVPPIIPPY